ncbi:Uncharacterised protein [Enterobacter cloacae]|nr:Uncharacterised protein [Enterobacter cloacae]
MVHLIGGAWNAKLHQIFIGIINQPTTVKTGARRGATPAIWFTYLPHQFIHRRFLRFLHTRFMHVSQLRHFGAFRFMAFAHGAFIIHQAGGRAGGFVRAGTESFGFTGGGLFGVSGGFLLYCFAGGFFLTFCGFCQMRFLYSRMPRLFGGVRRWRK